MDDRGYAIELYNETVSDLVTAAQDLDCFDFQTGIALGMDRGRQRYLPVEYHGFTWARREYRCFVPVTNYRTSLSRKEYLGVGVPLNGFHLGSRSFVDPAAPFAATAVVSPSASNATMSLKIVNPLNRTAMANVGKAYGGCCDLKLSNDTTAPLAYLEQLDPTEWIEGFVRPGGVEKRSGLYMPQPHDRNKIPVIVVHGLISNPMTWVTMVNELQVDPLIQDKYEFWAFYYPTGTPFPSEAAKLRRQIRAAREYVDPFRSDPALDQMVLVGHSMGGLVARLQITNSGGLVAHSIGLNPTESSTLPPDIQDALYWAPVESVRRTIFIATPHRGSEIASRPVGRFASRLIRLDGTSVFSLSELIDQRRNDVSGIVGEIPTSVELLAPTNPTLLAIASLPTSPCVTTHSIIGVCHGGVLVAPGDGVVPMASARIAGVESELFVDSDHEVHKKPESIHEVRRILLEHAYGRP